MCEIVVVSASAQTYTMLLQQQKGITMSITDKIAKSHTNLLVKFGTELIKLAAEKQLAMSTIKASGMTGATQALLTANVKAGFHDRAAKLGYTSGQLLAAVAGIHEAGRAVQTLNILPKPTTSASNAAYTSLMRRLGYHGGVSH